jgi:hypothetical protein
VVTGERKMDESQAMEKLTKQQIDQAITEISEDIDLTIERISYLEERIYSTTIVKDDVLRRARFHLNKKVIAYEKWKNNITQKQS